MKIFLLYKSKYEILVKKFQLLLLNFNIIMFDLKELKLMFLDPTDLIINNLNRLLSSNKTIKFIFS